MHKDFRVAYDSSLFQVTFELFGILIGALQNPLWWLKYRNINTFWGQFKTQFHELQTLLHYYF